MSDFDIAKNACSTTKVSQVFTEETNHDIPSAVDFHNPQTQSLDELPRDPSSSSLNESSPRKKLSKTFQSIHRKRHNFKNRSYTLDQLWRKNKNRRASQTVSSADLKNDDSESLNNLEVTSKSVETVADDTNSSKFDPLCFVFPPIFVRFPRDV